MTVSGWVRGHLDPIELELMENDKGGKEPELQGRGGHLSAGLVGADVRGGGRHGGTQVDRSSRSILGRNVSGAEVGVGGQSRNRV